MIQSPRQKYATPNDLHEVNPDEYDKGQLDTPMFSEQNWQSQKFDNLSFYVN